MLSLLLNNFANSMSTFWELCDNHGTMLSIPGDTRVFSVPEALLCILMARPHLHNVSKHRFKVEWLLCRRDQHSVPQVRQRPLLPDLNRGAPSARSATAPCGEHKSSTNLWVSDHLPFSLLFHTDIPIPFCCCSFCHCSGVFIEACLSFYMFLSMYLFWNPGLSFTFPPLQPSPWELAVCSSQAESTSLHPPCPMTMVDALGNASPAWFLGIPLTPSALSRLWSRLQRVVGITLLNANLIIQLPC